MAPGVLDAAHGDTAYTLQGSQQFHLGYQADGRRLFVANVDPNGLQINVETQGSAEGIRRYNLTGKGDWLSVAAGDIHLVTISAQSYPAVIAFAYLSPHMLMEPGTRPLGAPGAGGGVGQGVTELVVANSTAVNAFAATLAAVAGQTNYLAGFQVTGGGATAASLITIAVNGALGGTLFYFMQIPALPASPTPLVVEFSRPIPASGPNVAIVVNVGAFGAGNASEAVVIHGFRQ